MVGGDTSISRLPLSVKEAISTALQLDGECAVISNDPPGTGQAICDVEVADQAVVDSAVEAAKQALPAGLKPRRRARCDLASRRRDSPRTQSRAR